MIIDKFANYNNESPKIPAKFEFSVIGAVNCCQIVGVEN